MTSARAPDPPAIDPSSIDTGETDRVTASVPREDPLVGKVLAGKYAIGDVLGEGAMGRVYRARQVALDKPIAVKVLHRHLTGEERIAKRFHREARAASRLSHPNSLQILDFGATDDGVLYIAMELLDGEDLQTILDHDFPLSPARIAALLVPVLRALEEAHRAGIIHRDLKPENVIVLADRSGREHVKVCDFGIAKILDSEEGQAITVDGFVCGTPQYMAPEQARGDVIDHRSDIYAVGIVLYQMLCGAVPFVGENALGIITKHLMEKPVPPRVRRPDLGIPASLEAICARAITKDASDRWPTAAAMGDALERAATELGADADARLGAGPFRGPSRDAGDEPSSSDDAKTRELAIARAPARRRRIAVGAIAISVAIGGAAWLAHGMTSAPTAPLEPVAASEPTPPTTLAPDPIEEDPEPVVAAPAEPIVGAVEPPIEPTIEPEPTRDRARARRDREPTLPRSAEGARSEPIAAPAVPSVPPREVEAPAAADERAPGQIAFDEGRRLFLSNDVPGAIQRFEEAARLMPRSADVQKQLGRAYMRGGDVARSIAAYRRYVALAPEASDRAVVERIIAQHGAP